MMTIESILRNLRLRRTTPPDRRPYREVEDELRFHIEMRTRDNMAAGMSAEAAAEDAARRFGDFDQLRAICEEITKERLAGMLKVFKGVVWLMLGCGLTLILAAGMSPIRSVGAWLMLIASLCRLLIHLREIQPDQRRIEAAGHVPLSVINPPADFPSTGFAERPFRPDSMYDAAGRTPIERVISNENLSDQDQ
jgi:hypothetical protein